MLTVGWFSMERDRPGRQLLQTVQESIARGNIDAKTSFVFTNRDPGQSTESDLFFELVRSYNIHLACLFHRKLKITQNEKDPRIK